MPTFRTQRLVPYTPKQMFDLVADVGSYPEFLPLCESLEVHARENLGAGIEKLVCRMVAGLGLVRESFMTEVLLKPALRRIDVRYLEGPFRKLDNVWNFQVAPAGCSVDFFIDYEFRSLPLQVLMGAMFDRAFRKFAEAFEARAAEVYGSEDPLA